MKPYTSQRRVKEGNKSDSALFIRPVSRRLRVTVRALASPFASFSNANFPMTPDGRTYHLGTKEGEVANRILTVGSSARAEMLSSRLLDPLPGNSQVFQHMSSRGFLSITGQFNGTPISIVSHLMGMPNMDFMVRECRAVVQGPMAVVRLGTCGAVQRPAELGNLLIASRGCINVRRNPDSWTLGDGSDAYTTTLPVLPDLELASALVSEAKALMGHNRVVEGLNASADSFYSSQGRTGMDFDDKNEHLIDELCSQHPDLVSLEMETFQLLDLARCSFGSVRAAGMCIALAERYSNRFLEHYKLEELELEGGTVGLKALSGINLGTSVATETKHIASLLKIS